MLTFSKFIARTIGKSLSVAKFLKYHEEQLKAGDIGDKQRCGIWLGEGAKKLGLLPGSPVTTEQFKRLLKNYHPTQSKPGFLGSHALVQLRPREPSEGSIPVYPFQTAPSKSVSLIAETTDKRILELHKYWTKEVAQLMEKDAATRVRVDGADHNRQTGNLVIAAFTENRSRSGDLQTHTHLEVFNCTFDVKEKRWKALQAYDIGRHVPYYTAVYQNGMANDIRNLGYSLRVTKHGFEIEGVSQAMIQKFSQRSKAMKEKAEPWMMKTGRLITKGGMATLARLTRPRKDAPKKSVEEMVSARSEPNGPTVAEELQTVVAQAKASNTPGRVIDPNLEGQVIDAKACIDYAGKRLFERSSVVDVVAFKAIALEHSRGRVTNEQIEAEFNGRDEFIRHFDTVGEQQVERMTTREHVKLEERLIDWVHREQNAHTPYVSKWEKPDSLNEAQAKVTEALLSSTDGVVALRGSPGVGKTLVVSHVVAALKSAGYSPVVLAPLVQATQALKQSGVAESMTMQTFLKNKELQQSSKCQPIILDEAGKVSLRDLIDLEAIAKAGQHRLILSGDSRQHTSVPAGDGMRIMEKYSQLHCENLDLVVRQVDEQYLKAAQALADGKTREGLELLHKMGALQVASESEICRAIAKGYCLSLKDGNSALVVTPTWKEAEILSQPIRALLQRAGMVKREELPYKTFDSLEWTDAQKRDYLAYQKDLLLSFHTATQEFKQGECVTIQTVKVKGPSVEIVVKTADGHRAIVTSKHVHAYSVGQEKEVSLSTGDRILIEANRKKEGLINGHIDTIARFDEQGRIHLSKGGVIENDFRSFCPAYALPSTRVQGASAEHVYVAILYNSQAANEKSLLVSTTRGTEQIRMYVSSETELEKILGKSGERESALEFIGLEAARSEGHTLKVLKAPQLKVRM